MPLADQMMKLVRSHRRRPDRMAPALARSGPISSAAPTSRPRSASSRTPAWAGEGFFRLWHKLRDGAVGDQGSCRALIRAAVG
jgi:hypothetical protein